MKCCSTGSKFGGLFVAVMVAVTLALVAVKEKRERLSSRELVAEAQVGDAISMAQKRSSASRMFHIEISDGAQDSEAVAEIESEDSFDALSDSFDALSSGGSDNSTVSLDGELLSLLPTDRPDWTKVDVDTSDEIHYVTVMGIPASTIEQSLESLDDLLAADATQYVVQHVLDDEKFAELDKRSVTQELDLVQFGENWLDPNFEYDAVIEAPSGKYHQAWRRLAISKPERKYLRRLVVERLQTDRFSELLQMIGLAVAGLLVFHVGVGTLAKRQSQKKKTASSNANDSPESAS